MPCVHQLPEDISIRGGHKLSRTQCLEPLVYSGSLDHYTHEDVTPVIGREIRGLQLSNLLQTPDNHHLIKDLAILVSERGVVFLRDQNIDVLQMQEFGKKFSQLAGKPESSSLHVHPLTEEGSKLGDNIGVISSEKIKRGSLLQDLKDHSRFASSGWHSDITFEPVPSDYAMLKIHTLPSTGGDTLWASGYEIYDRLSTEMASFLETLTATHDANFFNNEARLLGNPLRAGIRGSVLNSGDNLQATHPVIRTNPVTGWKSVFVNKSFTKKINKLTNAESDLLLGYLFDLVTHNHDAQVRFKWQKNDVAIWDNRSTLHCATFDYDAVRTGDRVCSLGEAPYLDLKSTSRRVALARNGGEDIDVGNAKRDGGKGKKEIENGGEVEGRTNAT